MPTCPDCKKVMETREEYMEHRKYPCVDSTAIPVVKPVDTMDLKEPVCPECGERFKDLVGLGVHRSRKHGVKGSSRRANYHHKAPAPAPAPAPMAKIEPSNVVIKWCPKCQTIWDGAYALRFCPDDGAELQLPKRRKTFRVVGQEND